MIEFYLPDNTVIARMNKTNAHIDIVPEYATRIEQRISFANNTIQIVLFDTQTNQSLFTIRPLMNEISLQAQAPYQIVALSGAQYGSFAG